MKIIIKTDSLLTAGSDLDEFIKEFKKSLETGATSGEYRSEFLNFNWKSSNI